MEELLSRNITPLKKVQPSWCIHMRTAGGSSSVRLLFLTIPEHLSVISRDTHQRSSRFFNALTNPMFITLHSNSITSKSCIEAARPSRRGFGFRIESEYGKESLNDVEEEEVGRVRRKRRKRRWWSDKSRYFEEGEEEEPGILEEALDSFWIIKVFKSYGWLLPPIILSLLLATGPKAFVVVLAVPLAQSALTFVFKKLWGITNRQADSKLRKRKESATSNVSNGRPELNFKEQEMKAAKKKKVYRSWAVNDNGSVEKGSQMASSFRGWGDLDTVESNPHQSEMAVDPPRSPSTGSRLSNRRGNSDLPLLLRLLIAVFPFLGYWSKIL